MGTSLCTTSATWTAGGGGAGAGAGGLWQATLASNQTSDTIRVLITIDPLGATSAFMFRAGPESLRRLLLAIGATTNCSRAGRPMRASPEARGSLSVQVSRPSPNWWSFPDGWCTRAFASPGHSTGYLNPEVPVPHQLFLWAAARAARPTSGSGCPAVRQRCPSNRRESISKRPRGASPAPDRRWHIVCISTSRSHQPFRYQQG